MGLGETDDVPPPVRPAAPDPDDGSEPPDGTTVRLPDHNDLEETQEAAVLVDDDDHDEPPISPPAGARRRIRWWLILLAVALIGSSALVAKYALPKAAPPQPGAAPPPATAAPLPTSNTSGPGLIPPTGAEPPRTPPARPADALASWAAQVSPIAQVPAVALQAYGYAQLSMASTSPQCHLTWTTLAGIGEVESQHGQSGGAVLQPNGRSVPPILGPPLDGKDGRLLVNDTDAGAFDGDPIFDHAMGPMGILPSAWKVYAIDADNDGILDPYDIDDSSLAMARLLCSGGDDLATDGWTKAIGRQHQGSAYAKAVFDAADSYGQRTRNIG
jgi:hypothetical protein